VGEQMNWFKLDTGRYINLDNYDYIEVENNEDGSFDIEFLKCIRTKGNIDHPTFLKLLMEIQDG
jgi:hypothetical protein